jgi:hypothetical protein
MNDTELERRLLEWAKEYGGKDPGNGWPGRNFLATLVEHEGFVPNSRGYVPVPIRTAADEIEQAVMEMERKGFFKPGRVMRCEYFMLRAPFESKMQNMRAIGLPMSRAGYYLYLGQAKAFIAGALTQRAVA